MLIPIEKLINFKKNYYIDNFDPILKYSDNSIKINFFQKSTINNPIFRYNKDIEHLLIRYLCKKCIVIIYNYDIENIKSSDFYSYCYSSCPHYNEISNSKENLKLKFHIGLIKLIRYCYINNNLTSIGNALIERLVKSEYLDLCIYYYSQYIFDYLKINLIYYFDNLDIDSFQKLKNFHVMTKILYSKVNEIFIDKNDKFFNLLSIKLIYKYMGYKNKNINIEYIILTEDEMDFQRFMYLVNKFSMLNKSILLDLHILTILNFGKDKHKEYLYERYPEIRDEYENIISK